MACFAALVRYLVLFLATVSSNRVKRLGSAAKMRPAPHPLVFFRAAGRVAEPPAFRLSRDVCDRTSNRKPATAALNLLGPLRGARAPSAACLLGARLEVDVALPRRLGPVERAAPPRALTGLRRLVTVLGLVKAPHAPARSVPPWQGLVGLLAACAGRARRAERGVGGGGGCQMRLPNPPARSPLK